MENSDKNDELSVKFDGAFEQFRQLSDEQLGAAILQYLQQQRTGFIGAMAKRYILLSGDELLRAIQQMGQAVSVEAVEDPTIIIDPAAFYPAVSRAQLVEWMDRDIARLAILPMRAGVLPEELAMVAATIEQFRAEIAFLDAKALHDGQTQVKRLSL